MGRISAPAWRVTEGTGANAEGHPGLLPSVTTMATEVVPKTLGGAVKTSALAGSSPV